MPNDILQSIDAAIQQAGTNQQVISLLTDIKNGLGNLTLKDIGNKYVQNLNANGAQFNARDFIQFYQGIKQLDQDVIKALNLITNSVDAIGVIMRRGGMDRFQKLLESRSFTSLDSAGKQSYISTAAQHGAFSDLNSQIFQSVVKAMNSKGQTFSNNPQVIDKAVRKLAGYENRLNNIISRIQGNASPQWEGGNESWQKHEAAKRILKSQPNNKFAKREVAAAEVFHTAGSMEGLNQTEKNLIKKFKEEYSKALLLEDRERVSRNLKKEMATFKTMARPISVADRALQGLKDTINDTEEDFLRFCKGSPKGISLVTLAFAYATKKAAEFIGQISGIVTEMAKLDIQVGHTRTSFDSLFGKDSYNNFKNQFSLTRREMQEMSSVMTDAYRNGGVEMERMLSVAQNIKGQFGELDMRKFQEAASIMSSLTQEQTMALAGASMGTEDIANMYTTLSKNRNAGKAADLLEQGVFGGEPLIEGVSEGDKKIIEIQRKMAVIQENIQHSLKSIVGIVPSVLIAPKLLGGISSVTSAILAAVAYKQFFGGKGIPIGKIGAVGAGALAVYGGMNYLNNQAEKRVANSEELKQKRLNDIYGLTGISGSSQKEGIDWQKIHARGTSGAKAGAIIAGLLSAIGAGTVTSFTGPGALLTAAGAGAVGAAKGAGVGYGVGSGFELWRQTRKYSGNAFFQDEFGKLDQRMLDSMMESSQLQNELVELAKKDQRTRILSLRSIERAQIALEKISKGMYASNADANIAFARRNIENMVMAGGGAGAYRLNVASILENSVKKFSVNADLFGELLKQTAQETGIDEEARLTKTREILTAQADATDEFVKRVLDSVGEYEKIPSVIANSLQTRISQMNLDFRGRTMGGTTFGNMGLIRGQLANALSSFRDSMDSYLEENKGTRAAYEKLIKTQENLKTAISLMGEINIPGFNTNVLSDNGRLNEEVIRGNRNSVRREEEALKADILKRYGINEKTQMLLDQLRSPQEAVQKQRSDLNGMKPEDFTRAKQEEFLETFVKNAESKLAAITILSENSSLDSTKFGKRLKNQATKDQKELNKQIERAQKIKASGKEITLDQAQRYFSVGDLTTTLLNKQIAASREDVEFKGRNSEIARARNMEALASSVSNEQNAILQANAKATEGILRPLQEIVRVAETLVGQYNNDSTIRLLEEIKGINEEEREFLQFNNDSATYGNRLLLAQNAQIERRNRVIENIRSDLDKAQDQFKDDLNKALENSEIDQGTKDALKDYWEELNKLNTARRNFAENATKENLNLMTAQEAEVDRFRKENEGNDQFNRFAEGFETSANTLNLAITELRKNVVGNLSAAVRRLDSAIALFSQYTTRGGWRVAESGMRAGQTRAEVYGLRENSVGEARRVFRSNLSQINQMAEEELRQFQETYQSGIKAAEVAYNKSEKTAEDIKRLDQERLILQNEYVQKAAESEQKRLQAAESEANRVYDIERRRIDMVKEGLDIQLDYMQSIGAPFQEILRLEQQRVGVAEANYRNARENYKMVKESRAGAVAMRKAELTLMKAANDRAKAYYGAQNSALEKMFGNMIGAFSSVAGIIGPNNLAAKYGMGYMQGQNGVVLRGGNGRGVGLEGRKLAANSGLGRMESEMLGIGEKVSNTIDETQKGNSLLEDIKNIITDIRDKRNGEEAKPMVGGKPVVPTLPSNVGNTRRFSSPGRPRSAKAFKRGGRGGIGPLAGAEIYSLGSADADDDLFKSVANLKQNLLQDLAIQNSAEPNDWEEAEIIDKTNKEYDDKIAQINKNVKRQKKQVEFQKHLKDSAEGERKNQAARERRKQIEGTQGSLNPYLHLSNDEAQELRMLNDDVREGLISPQEAEKQEKILMGKVSQRLNSSPKSSSPQSPIQAASKTQQPKAPSQGNTQISRPKGSEKTSTKQMTSSGQKSLNGTQSSQITANKLDVEFKPATVTILFNNDMFEKKVVEIVTNEIKKSNA